MNSSRPPRDIGLFDEELVKNQDDEFHYRLNSAGYKILLNPNIYSIAPLPWIKLTHESAPESIIKKTLKTYKLIEKNSNSFDFKEKKYFYWMSFSAFNLATKKNPNILNAYHACGPGNTYKEIKKVIKDPKKLNVFLSYEEWRKELIDE